MKTTIIKIASIIMILSYQNIIAQWSNNPLINTPVCVWVGSQLRPEIVSDNKGGAIIVWLDYRLGNSNLFMQRLDALGLAKWQEGGKAVCFNTGNQFNHKIIQNGEGGCFVVWEDDRNGNFDIYAQKVDSAGNILWDSVGVTICDLPLDQEDSQLISDESGGAIIMWEFKQGAAGETGLYAQRINTHGQVLWDVNGIPIVTSPVPGPAQFLPKITDDGTGGAVIAWTDFTGSTANIFTQRVSSTGNILWAQNGLPVCVTDVEKRFQDIINVGSGEFVLGWKTYIPANDWDLRAQKIDTTGNIIWNSDGVVVCSSDVSINPSAIEFDNNNAVIFGWEDHRIPSVGGIIYCQKINLNGNIQWQPNGVSVSSLNGMQGYIQFVCDSNGNTIACWSDARINPMWDIYSQEFDVSGTRLWEQQGREVCIADGFKALKNIIITNNEDFIITWDDQRNIDADIYAQSLNSLITSVNNLTTKIPELYILDQNYPNPFNPNTVINLSIPNTGYIKLKVYDILGNEIATLVNEEKLPGNYSVEWDASSLASGVYIYRLQAGSFVQTRKMILMK